MRPQTTIRIAASDTAGATYADLIRPTERRAALAYDALLIVTGSLLIGLAAQIAIRLPGSPVPVTGQTLAVLLIGALLGSRRGTLSVVVYLLEGLTGLPVFASGGSGLIHALGPTGGYLVGFIGAAYITGHLSERGWDRNVLSTALAMLIGNTIIYAVGLLWLSLYVGEHTVAIGLWPFVPGDAVKLVLAAVTLPSGWKVLKLVS